MNIYKKPNLYTLIRHHHLNKIQQARTKKEEFERKCPKFYFIHNYKTLGTTIFDQMNTNYKKRYYGHISFEKWEKQNYPVKLNKKEITDTHMSYTIPLSIDHLCINKLIHLNIIPQTQLSKISFMMIVREPIERFISICNYHDEKPSQLLKKLKNKEGDNFFQSKLLNNNYNLKINTIKMTNKKAISTWFSKHGVKVDLSKRLNVSKKKYSIEDLTKDDIEYLRIFYKDDYILYNNAQ